jgi:CDP-diacylglycerol--glycerol-3-phosphate 3-phosphatidyltransferase
MYRANEYQVLKSNKGQGNIKIHEYENGEWTYHAKGAWLYEKQTADEAVGPTMTVIGSSNYSYRSNRRDTEA